MTSNTKELRGIVHGRTIELEGDPGLPEGQAVAVIVRPAEKTLPDDPADLARRRAAAMDAFKRLRESNPYFEIADPVAWQRETRVDRPLPFREA